MRLTSIVWTPEQIAERWSCSPKAVVEMCRDGRLRGAFKAGRVWRVSNAALMAHETAGLEDRTVA